jgi:DNA-binding CsgD family transcriptional regulator
VRVRYNTLSSREKEIMALVTVGFMNKQIAAAIGLGEVTVKVHRHKLMKKLGAQSLPDLVRIADMLKISQIKPAGCGAKGRQAVVASVVRGAAGGVQFPMTSALGDTRKSSERAKPVAE